VCDCELGFGAARGKKEAAGVWADAAAALQGFLADPWLLRPADGPDAGTVQVEVPPLDLQEEGEDEAHRAAMQRQAAAAEDFARRLEGAYGSPVSPISLSTCSC
jgi:hypothetical protein